MVVIQLSTQDVLPSELIDLVIATVASNCDGIYNIRQRRHDLASCGLVCRAFYLPSRRYLFENTTLITKHGERELQSLKKLREILSTNSILKIQIYHLVIADKTPSGYTGWKRPGRTLLGEENLPHILRLLPSLRSLTISAIQDVYWTSFNGELISALKGLRSLCINLRRLKLKKLRDVPVGFVHQWDEVVEIELNSVHMVDDHSVLTPFDTHDIHPTISKNLISVPHLEHLSLSGDFDFPESVQETLSTQLSCLRSLYIMLVPFWQSKSSWLQAWILIIRTSKSLARLSLHFLFSHPLYSSHGRPVSIRQFPSLHSVELHEANRRGLLAEIAQFLAPQDTSLKIRSILLTIDLFRDPESAFLHAGSQPAWALLDNAWTNAELYRDLEKVQISLNFFHDQKHTKDWERSILDVLEDCSSQLLPLLSSSGQVKLEFAVERGHKNDRASNLYYEGGGSARSAAMHKGGRRAIDMNETGIETSCQPSKVWATIATPDPQRALSRMSIVMGCMCMM